MNKLLLQPFFKHPIVSALLNQNEKIVALSLDQEALFYSASFLKAKRSLVIVKESRYQAQLLYQKISPLVKESRLFLVEDSLRLEAIATSPEIKAERILNLSLFLEDKHLIITHIGAVLRYFPNPKLFEANTLRFEVNQIIDPKQLTIELSKIGYEKVALVDRPLTYASRGGIIDVFTINYHEPIRFEFFGDEIESIRRFDLYSQKTINEIKQVKILPASDLLFSDVDLKLLNQKLLVENNFTLDIKNQVQADLNYLAAGIYSEKHYHYLSELSNQFLFLDYLTNPLVILAPIEKIKLEAEKLVFDTKDYFQELKKLQQYVSKAAVFSTLELINEKYPVSIVHDFLNNNSLEIGISPNENVKENLTLVINKMRSEAEHKTVIVTLVGSYFKKFQDILNSHQIPFQIIKKNEMIKSGINLLEVDNQISYEHQNQVIYTALDLFDNVVRKTRYTSQFLQAKLTLDYQELNPKDYVVHNLYGIGQFQAIITKEINGLTKDFLQIFYRDNDELLVPLEQFRFVRRYVSSEGIIPRLSKLGSGEWSKTKQRISENVTNIAERLVKLYLERKEKIGFAFSKDSALQKEFDADIDFELTKDQVTSIAEIKADMEAAYPMDRLLCGDVGFGKTEVAMRAAFKAVIDQKQVAFLCPTTILSRQHYQTFLKRFENFPVKIALLNRFVLPKQQKEIIEDIALGKYDIVIGTHRLLSKDVKFFDLGLLVIDEEQRFGVEHKELIKELKQSIDVLSLSATPIPRTLQMSLINVRSLSQLNTPPIHRLPVATYVVEKDFNLIIDIISKEIARGGQVFYLYNNIEMIYTVAYQIQQALPEISVKVAHGQMNRDEIEEAMVNFTENQYQVLVCTTIIETGIDIANANTIIVENAQNFGLAQLYQIRGRVGRSSRLAYAYLLIPKQRQLTEVAEKRLKAIKEFTELGSGYKIALRDLTIRGAGDLLGDNQSGFIDTIGMDLYIELLQEAIAVAQGQAKPEVKKPRIPMEVNAYIPQDFTDADRDKLYLYQKIDKIKTILELQEVFLEVSDYFGKLPNSVELLFEKKRLELILALDEIDSFKERDFEVVIILTQEFSDLIDGVKLFEMINQLSPEIKIKYLRSKIHIYVSKNTDWLKLTITVLNNLKLVTRKG